MSTSLSRQLEQLRTPSTAASAPASSAAAGFSLFSAGPFLIEESDVLDERQLEILSVEAFAQIEQESPHLENFRARVFDDDEEMVSKEEEENDSPSSWQEDFLMLLTPTALSKPTQFLLQWMVSKHRVHITHPECLVWCVMPYYEYRIFHRVVESVAVLPSAKYPQWFAAFKRSCHPATQIGMHKLIAGDRGFLKLLTDLILKTRMHQNRFRESNYDNVVFFYCSSVLGALKNCSTINESQVYNIMQVIVAGLKSDHKEFYALGATLMARVFPLIRLKAKVANKSLRVLSKGCKDRTSETTLSLLLVIFRTQIEIVDKDKVLSLLARHEDQVKTVFRQPDMDDDDVDFARRVIYCLALMCDYVGKTTPLRDDVLCTLDCVLEAVSSPSVVPTTESAVLLIVSMSQAYLQFKTQRRRAKKEGSASLDLLKKISARCKQILSSMKRSFPAEYLQHSMVQTEEIDIVFMGGSLDTPPTHEEITVKRILLDNPLVSTVKKEVLVLSSKERCQERKTLLKENAGATKIMYDSVKPAFLFQQMELEELITVTLNLVRLFEKKVAVLSTIVKFICSEEFSGSADVQQWLAGKGIELDYLILPLLVIHNDESKSLLLDAITKSWYFDHVDSVVQRVLKCRWKKEDTFKLVNVQVWSKITEALTGEKLLSAAERLLSSDFHQSPDFAAIVLALLTNQLSAGKKAAKSGQHRDEQKVAAAKAMLNVLRAVTSKLEVAHEKSQASDDVPAKQGHDVARLVFLSKTRKQIPVELLLAAVESLNVAKDFGDESIVDQILFLACAVKRECAVVGEKLLEIYDGAIGTGDQREHNLADSTLKPLVKQSDVDSGNVGFTANMKLHCLKLLADELKTSKDAAKRFAELKSYTLPRVLTVVGGGNRKLRKAAMKVMEAGLSDGKQTTVASSYAPFISYLVEQKSEILSHDGNVDKIMREYLQENKPAEAILKSLLASACSSADLFAHTTMFLAPLSGSRSELEKIAQYGSTLLSSSPDIGGQALESLLRTFVTPMTAHLQSPKCWSFINAAVRSSGSISYGNIMQPIPLVVLGLIDVSGLLDKGDVLKLFSALVDMREVCDDSDVLMECRNVIQRLPLTADMFRDKLAEIWGDDQVVVASRSRGRSEGGKTRQSMLPEPTQKPQDFDGGQWKRTVFLLEMFSGRSLENCAVALLKPFFLLLKQICGSEGDENAYNVDLALSCILQVVEQTSNEDILQLDTSMVNPELLVHCINSCKNPDTKSIALLILAKASSICNAEYVLQNSIPIFTFMGDHFLKIESRHSFEVACQAIGIIIPHIQKVCQAKGQKVVDETNLNVVTTFVDASIDMPTHRFKTFLHKLVVCLGERKHLWILTLLLLLALGKRKRYIDGSQARVQKRNKEDKLQQILDLYSAFSPKAQVEALLQMMVNLKQDSPTIRQLLRMAMGDGAEDPETGEASQSRDDFDLLRLKMLNFVARLLGSRLFADQVQTSLRENDDIKQQLQLLVECAIISIGICEKRESKIRQHMMHYGDKVLEGTLALLPSDVFVQLFNSLLANENDLVRRKILEVLNAKLQLQDEAIMSEESLTSLLGPILVLAKGGDESRDETVFNQQLAMLVLRSFARGSGAKNPGEFKLVCVQLTKKSFLKTLENPNVIASALLCLTEIVQAIGPHAVSCLPSLVLWLLDLLDDGKTDITRPILLNSLILAVQRLMENFSGFLNPYFKRFVISTCSLSSLQHKQQQEQQHSEQNRHIASRIKNLQSSMAAGIPTHGLLAITRQCYDEVIGDPQAVVTLATIVKENVGRLDKTQALAVSPPFMEFFMEAFKYRQQSHGRESSQQVTNEVEGAIIAAFMTLTLKLSLDDFKPLFYRVFNLLSLDPDLNICATVFHVTLEVAQKLKSLFDFVCQTLVQKTTVVLNLCSRDEFAKLRKGADDELSLQTLSYMLDSLASIFAFNRIESLLTKNYEDHVNAILALFEYKFQTEERTRLFFEKMSNCLTMLASSTDDETQWKYLNYQVLFCLRSSSPEVRKCTLGVLSRFVEAKGENYMSVLPDAVPFLCEMLEDEEPELEEACKGLIKRMEEVFGQSIESFFE